MTAERAEQSRDPVKSAGTMPRSFVLFFGPFVPETFLPEEEEQKALRSPLALAPWASERNLGEPGSVVISRVFLTGMKSLPVKLLR